MKSQIKLLSHKKWHYLRLEYLLKDKYTKGVISAIDIITTSVCLPLPILLRCVCGEERITTTLITQIKEMPFQLTDI